MSETELLRQDASNRQRALEDGSFIVEAPAGAGKTELLTQRYLRLLGRVAEPEEIVAITFTNKAAAEMRGRILGNLELAAGGARPPEPHKQITFDLAREVLARGWDLIGQPGRLRITTIDALCGQLARQMPFLSRFGAQPAVIEEVGHHYEEAARRTLQMLDGADAAVAETVAGALRYFDNDAGRLLKLLVQMLARRDQWLHRAGRQNAQEEAEWALRHLVAGDLRRLVEVLDADVQRWLMPVARYAASNLPCEDSIALLLDWETPIPETPEALPLWRSVCDLLLTQKGEFRKSVNVNQGFPASEAGKPYKQALSDIIATLPDARPLAGIRRLPQPKHGDEEWQIVGIFAALLKLAAAQLWLVFQEAREVDFIEVAQRALNALADEQGAPTDLALRLDYRIQHLLVDEFQDTSPTQKMLLQHLTEGWTPGDGRTLFAVGDPMQSIYRFRKADVGLFLRVAERGIGQLALPRLQLARNNRSCPAVVDWVNAAFAQVFPAGDDVVRGAIRYREFVATRDALPQAGVEVHAVISGAGADALEAQRMLEIIRRERAADPNRKIAVLVRARSHLQALVAEIRRQPCGLRFQAVEIEPLAARQPVQDLLALIRAMHHRADRVYWLAVLRAPWCGLTLADLHVLAADDQQTTLWALMNDAARVSRLSEDGRYRLSHVREVLSEAYAHQGRQPVRCWVEATWLRLGGAGCLAGSADAEDVQALLDLTERLDVAGRFTPEQLEKEMERLYAAPDAGGELLQFMTIHKSKGLEFDTVILPGLHRKPRAGDQPLLLWEEVALDDAEETLVAAPLNRHGKSDGPPTAYDYLGALEKQRTGNEAARVLYVAATRAVRKLHLVAVACPGNDGELKPPAGSFLELLWGAVEQDFARAGPQAAELIVAAGDDAGFASRLVRVCDPVVPAQMDAVAASPAPATIAGAGLDMGERDPLAASLGSLAHLYLEMMARDGPECWTPQRIRELSAAMTAWLIQQGHAPAAAGQGAAELVAALAAMLESEIGLWVLRPRPDAAAELALSSADADGAIATHVVDRTFVEDGVRWVIDYKLVRHAGGELEAFLLQRAEEYRPQLQRYAALFAGQGMPVRMAVYFIAQGWLATLDQQA